MKLKTILGLSLLVNVALISFLVTQTVLHPRHGGGGPDQIAERGADAPRGRALERLPRELRGLAHLDTLSEDQRQLVRTVIDAQLPEVRARGDRAREASREFRNAVDNPAIDPAQLRALADMMISARRDHQEAAVTLLLDAMATLPPEARATLAKTRRGRWERGRHREREQYRRQP